MFLDLNLSIYKTFIMQSLLSVAHLKLYCHCFVWCAVCVYATEVTQSIVPSPWSGSTLYPGSCVFKWVCVCALLCMSLCQYVRASVHVSVCGGSSVRAFNSLSHHVCSNTISPAMCSWEGSAVCTLGIIKRETGSSTTTYSRELLDHKCGPDKLHKNPCWDKFFSLIYDW